MKFFGELEVTMVIGLCWGESDNKLIISTVSELFHCSRSVHMKEELLRCHIFASTSLYRAFSACFDFISNWDGVVGVFVRFLGCCDLRLGLSVILFLGFCCCFSAGMFVGFISSLPDWDGSCCFFAFSFCSRFSFCSST